MVEVPVTRTCRNIEHATVYRRAPWKRSIVLAVAVALYAAVLPYVWQTMGEPRRRAVEEAEAIEARKLADADTAVLESDGEVVVSWGDSDGAASSPADADEMNATDDEFVQTSDNETSNKDADAEDEDEDKDDERPLPSPYLPDAGAAAALFMAVTCSVLFNLLCHWFVWFHALAYFSPEEKVAADCHVLVLPYAHRGQPELVAVARDAKSGRLFFEFQRQRFELLESLPVGEVRLVGLSAASERVDSDDEELALRRMTPAQRADCEKRTLDAVRRLGVFAPVVCRVDAPLETYLASRGLGSEAEVAAQRDRFGVNTLAVTMKRIPDLMKEQLLAPLAMFQFFSAALWLMDEYWQFTMFNLLTIVLMEGTTAFQRHRTLSTLKGLAPKPYRVPAFRGGVWVDVFTTDLLPGDLISLSSSAHDASAAAPANGQQQQQQQKPQRPRGTDAVPCDCVVLHGSAVVNEATLTGESVPQMKDALKATGHADTSAPLDMTGRDRVHVLFSGTTIISATPGDSGQKQQQQQAAKAFPTSPDGGCLCYVLRTGFGSSQGELMQMIEFSTEAVSADARETGAALLVLLCFALVSAGYVFKRGMEKGDRTTHELLLKCVIILTSVVPRQLPVQMALAVNHALIKLMGNGIYCTEPYRVPYSGKITHCLFDKTGTLTTDELVPVGVVNNNDDASSSTSKEAQAFDKLAAVRDASPDAVMVLAACHSLVALPVTAAQQPQQQQQQAPELLGDPIELAGMRGVEWSFDAATQTARPGDWAPMEAALAKLRLQMAQLQRAQQPPGQQQPTAAALAALKTEQDAASAKAAALEAAIKLSKARADKSGVKSLRILERFHFSSKLQRMSVLCQVHRRGAASPDPGPVCLVKGSPEAISKLLAPGARPRWYRAAYRSLAERGMRVLALAHKSLPADTRAASLGRGEAESGLSFAGFIAFECKTRGDSAVVIRSLREADHRVHMLTGDAPLTALHVARVTNICGDGPRRLATPLLLTETGPDAAEWVAATGPGAADEEDGDEETPEKGEQQQQHRIPFDADQMGALSEQHDLLTTEDALLAAAHMSHGRLWQFVDRIQVFARMSPQGKAKVIRMIQQYRPGGGDLEADALAPGKQQNFVFMCGDGGNDVGALKQADVGLALLSGYGNANTDDVLDAGSDGPADADALATTTTGGGGHDAEALLNRKAAEFKVRARAAEKQRKAEFAVIRTEVTARQRERIEHEVQEAYARGESGMMVQFSAAKKVMNDMKAELARESERLNRKYNVSLRKSSSKKKPHGNDDDGAPDDDPTALALEALEDPNALPVVRPGDASVAAPFTARTPSVQSAVQLIRQGRCTLLSALQQQQIMMLECTISAYCLAALSLEGARSSERQMMASSWLIMTASLAFSYSTPVDKMHPVRPIRSLFHPAVFISILGQAAIHLFCMVTAVQLAKEAMGEDKLQEVIRFNRRVARGLEKKVAAEGDEAGSLDALADMMMLWSQPFMPNLMNTVIFLVETSQIMAVLFVNYKGRPWMLGILENHALFLSLFLCVGGLVFAAWEVSPAANRLIHLEPFPDDAFRFRIVGLVLTTLAGTFVWDRLVTAVFARDIFRAMMEQARLTTWRDLLPVVVTLLKVALGLGVFATGNPLVWMGAYWAYRKRNSMLEARELAAIGE